MCDPKGQGPSRDFIFEAGAAAFFNVLLPSRRCCPHGHKPKMAIDLQHLTCMHRGVGLKQMSAGLFICEIRDKKRAGNVIHENRRKRLRLEIGGWSANTLRLSVEVFSAGFESMELV